MLTHRALRGCGADSGVGEQDRNQDQLGEDQYRYADAGGEGKIADDRDVDDHQHGEAHHVGEQGGQTGHEQTTEGVARSDVLVGTPADVLHDAVHLLRAMGQTDGEYQEGHQDGIGVQFIAGQVHET
ncbi:hypothetical protein D9M71_725680 [compost metagenome]